MKKMRKSIVSVVVCVSLLLVGTCSLHHVQASTDTGYTVAQIQELITNKAAPVETGKVFAGWYTDDTYKTPVTSVDVVDENTVPKFVDEAALTIKLQVSPRTTSTSTIADIRFVSSVDSLNYQKVSFTVDSTGSVDPVFDADTAYTKIYAGGQEYDPTIFSNDSQYVVTAIWDGIGRGTNGVTDDATSNFGKTITVTPSWTTMDGTVVTGTQRTFEINDGLYETEIEDTNPTNDTTGGAEHVWGTLTEAVASANTNGVTGENAEHVVITVLKDVTATSKWTIQKNIIIQNTAGKDITITRGANFKDDMFYIQESSSLKLITSSNAEGSLIIDANSSTAIVGRTVNSLAKFYLGTRVTMKNAYSSNIGAAIYNNKGTAIIEGKITSNKTSASHGGAVYNTGTLTMNEGEISDNQCLRFGAGVYSSGTFTMNSGKICGNNTYTSKTNEGYARGAGVYAYGSTGTFTMNGGTIESNGPTNSALNNLYGGGVCVYQGSFTMNGGTISDTNTASKGAGLYIYSGVTFTKTDSAIISGEIYNGNLSQ